MGNLIMVLGRSGMGKSTSIRNLDPKTTFIVNVLNKRLPFKGADKLYNKDSKNIIGLDDWKKITDVIGRVSDNEAFKHIRNLVIDDSTYIMRKEFFDKANVTGYAKYVELAQHSQVIIKACEKARQDLNVFMLWHCEPITSDSTIIGYKASTVGKMLDEKYNPLEIAGITLFTEVKYDESGKPQYGFYTRLVKQGNIEYPAKTPDGMFTNEQEFIPNDLSIVAKAIDEYYK